MLIHAVIFYLLAIIACIGAGSMFWSLVARGLIPGTNTLANPSSVELGITGLFAIGIVALFLNFFIPVSVWLSLLLVFICLLSGLIYLFRVPRPRLFTLLVFLGVLVLFAVWGSKFLLRVDAGIYHLPAISWIKDEPIVIGLANIQSRFGFNSLSLSVLAVFWLPFYQVKGMLLANYLPAILVIFVFIDHLLKFPANRSACLSMSKVFAGFTLACFAASPVLLLTSTTSTDVAPNVLTLLSVFVFLRGFENHRARLPEVATDYMMLWVIAIFAVLAKLSAITPALLAFIYMLGHRDLLGIVTIRRTMIFLSLVSAAWVLRNFLLSGCLIFPVGLTCMDSDTIPWSLGPEKAEYVRLTIERWARAPGADFLEHGASTDWFDTWIQAPNRGQRATKVAIRLLGVSAIVLSYLSALLLLRRTKSPDQTTNWKKSQVPAALAWLSTFVAFIFGFVAAPDPRFWWGSFTALMILPVTAVAFLLIRQGITIGYRSIVAALLLAALTVGTWVLKRGFSWEAINTPMTTFREVIPEVETRQIPADGFVMNAPVEGDMCWLVIKPCSAEDPRGLKQDRFGPYLVYLREAEGTGKR